MALIYYEPLFLEHETGRHPEHAKRIIPAAARLESLAAQFNCVRPAWQPLSTDELASIHGAAHIDWVRAVAEQGGGLLDPDTVVSPRSYEVARSAAGAACDAVDKVVVEIADVYAGGRIVSLLEGGYNPAAVVESLECHVQQLLQPL